MQPSKHHDPGKIRHLTRVSFLLPVKLPPELDAFELVLIHLKKLVESTDSLIKGYTYSAFPDGVYMGVWTADRDYQIGSEIIKKGQTVTDRHSLIHFDIANLGPEDRDMLNCVAALHKEIANKYIECGAGQAVIWVVAGRLFRIAYPEYERIFAEASMNVPK